MSARLFLAWASALCFSVAAAGGLFDAGATSRARLPEFFATATYDPLPTMFPMLASAEPASPTVTPLPPPVVPPPDAAGISATTPPLGAVSPQPHPLKPDTLWLGSGDACSVRIEMHGGRPYVPVVVDGVRREFLLSTIGSSAIDAVLPVDGTAGASVLRTLQIGDLRFTDVHVVRERVAPFSQTYLGTAADGILGTDLFARFPVTIDYPDGTLTIYRTEAAALAARLPGTSVIPLQSIHGDPTVACSVEGASLGPCFVDVSSDADLVLRAHPVEEALFIRYHSPHMTMREAQPGREVGGGMLRAQSLTLGSTTISGPLVQLPTGEDKRAKPKPYAAIGSGALGRFVATVDEPGGVLALASAQPAGAETQFDRSGLWLVWRSGVVMVRSVDDGSPGDAAGVAGGDSILAINGKPAHDLDAVRALLIGMPGQRVTVTYQRGARRRDVVLMLRTLM